MIRPCGFYWSRIMPISYENFLSETEILEYYRKKIDEVIKSINKVTTFLDEELPEYLEQEVREQNKFLLSQIKEINIKINDIDALIEKYKKEIDKSIEDLTDRHVRDVAYLDQKILDNYQELSDKIIDVQRYLVNYLDTAIYNLETKWRVDFGILKKIISDNWISIVNYVNEHYNKLSQTTIKVTNPITGNGIMTLQDALDTIVSFISNGLTAYQYRMLELTAEEYRDLNLTAYEYRMYGVGGDVRDKICMLIDLYGRTVDQPMSSVYGVLNGGVNSDMSDYDLTAEQYQRVSERYGAIGLDRYGRYALSNHGTALIKDTVRIYGQVEFSGESTVESKEVILSIPTEFMDMELPTAELTNDDSIINLMLSYESEAVGVEDGSYTVELKRGQLVDGGISCTVKCINNAVDNAGNKCPIIIDIYGYTSTLKNGHYDLPS